MKKPKEPRFVAQTLAWCNHQRVKRGKKVLKRLPKGTRYVGTSCPCGAATGLYVGGFDYFERSPDDVPLGHLPKPVELFVEAFDSGQLPQYEL